MNIANEQSRVKWAILAVFQNPNKKLVASKYFLYEGMNTVGSDKQSSEVLLEADGVSPSHAEITITDEGDAFIEDIGSKQGVYKKASLNPHKKVRLEKGCRYSIIPDQEFYIGKYKCFVVPFDNDYKTGEMRRIKEKNEINKKENSQIKNEKKLPGSVDLVETDLDEEQEHNQDSNELRHLEKNGQMNQDPIPEEQHFEKTLELEDKEESDHELFKAADQSSANAEKGSNEIIEKTLEINSEGEGDNNIDQLFETEGSPVKTDKNTTEQFEKTLELDSDPDNTKDDHLFSQNSKDHESQKKQSQHQEEQCEKTLALSSEGESDHSHLFTSQNEGNEKNGNSQGSQNSRQQENQQFEKTLELSDKDSDNENNDLFKTTTGDHYEKTLELSDHSSQDSDNPFGDGKSKKDGSMKNESQKDNNSMECEATPPLKDIDSENEHEQQQKQLEIQEKHNQQPISKAYVYGKQNEQEKVAIDMEERQKIGERVRSSYLLKRQSAIRQAQQQEQPKEQDQNEKQAQFLEKQSQEVVNEGSKSQKEKDLCEITVRKEDIEKEKTEQEREGMIVEFENKELLANLALQATLIDGDDDDIEEQENEQMCFSQNSKSKNNTTAKSSSLQSQKQGNSQPININQNEYNSQNVKNQYSDLQATLMDSPSVSSYSQTAPVGLCSTLVDSPAESNSKPSSKGSKKSRGISPSLQGEDENVMSQKSYKRKSPISLSPTFLDEEVSLSLLQATNTVQKSSQGSGKFKQNNELNQLEATLINTPSPMSSKSPCPSPLANTLIDSPQSSQHQEKDSQEKEFMKLKIQQQEEELAKLKELLMKSSFNSSNTAGNRNEGNSEKSLDKKIEGKNNDLRPQQYNYVINVIAEECHIPKVQQANAVGQGNLQKAQPQPVKYSATLPEQAIIKQQNQQKKNINLDKVDDFDDLFGNEDDDDENEKDGKNSKNISNSSCNNGTKLNTSNNASNEEENDAHSRNILDEKSQQSQYQLSRGSKEDSNSVENNGGTDPSGGANKNNFSGLFNKKCIKRTLTMSASKKILSGELLSTTQPNVSSSRPQGSPQRGLLFGNRGESSEEVNSKMNLMKAQSAPRSEAIPISQSKEDLVEHSGTLVESPRVFNASEESDSGEDPKKKLKVNSNWGLLKQIKSSGAISKLADENSSGSALEKEKPRKIPGNQRNLPKIPESSQKDSEGPSQEQQSDRKDNGMVIEKKGELCVCISGFQLSAEQKRGLKYLKCSISSGIEDDFNILVISEPKRTIKLLLALMKRVPVVTEKWLTDSIKSGNIIQDFQNYYPEGDNFKQRFNGQDIAQLIKRRRSIGQDNLIFEGLTFYLSKSLKEPSSQELEVIINAGAGNIRKTLPNKQMKKEQKVYMILSKSDIQLYKACHKLKNVTCATEQLILDAAQNSEFELLPQYIINSQEFFNQED